METVTVRESWLKIRLASYGIAALCFGYFAAYVPYSMMTKMITKGLFAGMDGKGFSGFEVQPLIVLGSSLAFFIVISIMGWWKFATHTNILGFSLPKPRWYTLISGLCTAAQIITTTLAYTFSGVSIVFAMLLMRGGVLAMAPMVDLIARRRRRKIYWPSWVAAALSFGALFTSLTNGAGTNITLVAAVDIGIYLFVYFFRLLFMSNRAKSDDQDEKKRYFVEEQLVANTVLPLALLVIGLIGSGMVTDSIPGQIWMGIVEFPFKGFNPHLLAIGFFSFGTGIFGSLIFLDKRENTFTVPANRSASIIAGLIATYLLAALFGQKYPGTNELIGVALIIFAIFFLAWRAAIEKKSKTVKS